MPRRNRKSLGNYLYHVLNRANGRLRIFKKQSDFDALERILGEAQQLFNMRIVGYCLMSNHWHLLLWPRNDGDLSAFMQWVTTTHAKRYHVSHSSTGMGHLYQGRFKSFPVQGNNYYLSVLRYIEANPVKASLVKDAAHWPWNSYSHHIGVEVESPITICKSPQPIPSNWKALVHKDITKEQTKIIKTSIDKGAPLGEKQWVVKTAKALNIESSLRPQGRPKKDEI